MLYTDLEGFVRCYECKELISTDGDYVNIETSESPEVPLCMRCASTCFDCGKEYPKPILTEDNEPWCADCIQFFNEDPDAWRDRFKRNRLREFNCVSSH